MALIPLVSEEYPHARTSSDRAQLCLVADLDQGIYLVVRRHVSVPDDARETERDARHAMDSATTLTLDSAADHGWERLHDGMDPEVALRAVNQELRGFGADGYRDRWGDPPAAIGMQQVLDAELAAQLQRDERAMDSPSTDSALGLT